MTRITKDPEERKDEIIDAAEELFLTKGYEQTAVSDIVKKVGVAQGLFYYYFKGKDEILNAISNKLLGVMTREIVKLAEDPEKDALTKLDMLFESTLDSLGLRKKGILKLSNHVHKAQNGVLHRKFAEKFVEQMVPVVSSIVRQGVKEGVFDTQHPDEVVGMLLSWAAFNHDSIQFPVADVQFFREKAAALSDIVERMLGAKKGSLDFAKYVEWFDLK